MEGREVEIRKKMLTAKIQIFKIWDLRSILFCLCLKAHWPIKSSLTLLVRGYLSTSHSNSQPSAGLGKANYRTSYESTPTFFFCLLFWPGCLGSRYAVRFSVLGNNTVSQPVSGACRSHRQIRYHTGYGLSCPFSRRQ